MSDVQAFATDLAYASRIKPKEIHELMSREASGMANFGYTEIDQKNYLQTRRQQSLIYGEAGSLLRYFQQQLVHNPSFHYVVQLDIEEQITNIFWPDVKVTIDYAHFGDVFSFDNTFGTNKEFRPLAGFIGFNHHSETVIFGAALLYDEKVESFK
ncbi:protein FAR1-RELATED SEQUENCE 5-like [Castanea sativa]|uniref:protein FAR1-RELATED SEQUENCE 5-like n=1 Tax=Castanea sativa TaxID=21020 RepID=UPI003F653096